jgi:hypothetical protein
LESLSAVLADEANGKSTAGVLMDASPFTLTYHLAWCAADAIVRVDEHSIGSLE